MIKKFLATLALGLAALGYSGAVLAQAAPASAPTTAAAAALVRLRGIVGPGR